MIRFLNPNLVAIVVVFASSVVPQAAPGQAPSAPAQKYDLVLIGDSITQTLHNFGGKYAPLEAVWNKHYAPRHALNLGHSGIRIEGTLAKFKQGELQGLTPKVAILLIGTNNADDRNFPDSETPEQIYSGTKTIVQSIQHASPSTKILILRIFPRGGDDEKGVSEPVSHASQKCIETAFRAGELTAQLADGKQVFWLDVNHVFLRPDGSINTDLMPDFLHPNQAGAEAWAQAIEPTLATLMGDQPIVDPQPNNYVVPATREDDSYDWMARHKAALAAKAVHPQVVFIGDSITHHMGGTPAPTGFYIGSRGATFWEEITKNRPGLNLGFGGEWTQNAIWRLDHGELDGLDPRRVVLMIGTNNVLRGSGDSDQIVAGVRECLLRIRAKTPHAKITLMGVLPCHNPATDPKRVLAAKVNSGLAALAEEAKVDYLDLSARFINADGNIPATLMGDAVHPTPAGYEIWRAALEPELKADDLKPTKTTVK